MEIDELFEWGGPYPATRKKIAFMSSLGLRQVVTSSTSTVKSRNQSSTSTHGKVRRSRSQNLKTRTLRKTQVLSKQVRPARTVNSKDQNVTELTHSPMRPKTKSKRQRATISKSKLSQNHLGDACPQTSKAPRSKMVFTGTCLTDAQKNVANQFASTFGAKFINVWNTERITHVVGNDQGDAKTNRTLKYIKGLITHKWLVSFAWIEKSLEKGTVQNEEPYEFVGHKESPDDKLNKPKESRETKVNFLKGFKLFTKKNAGKNLPSDFRKEMTSLVELGGGKVLSMMPTATRSKDEHFLVVMDRVKTSKHEKAKFKQITATQLIDTMSNFTNPLIV